MKYYQLIKFNNQQQKQTLQLLLINIKKLNRRYDNLKVITLINQWFLKNEKFLQKNQILINNNFFKNKYYLIYSFLYNNDICYCKQCSKIIGFKEIDKRRFNKRFCSSSCSSSNKDVILKYKNTCLQKYGVTYVPITQERKIKVKNTCLQKYGVDNPAKYEKIKNTISNTCKIVLNSKEVKHKKQQTYFKKYNSIIPLADKRFNKILSWNKMVIPLFSIQDLTGKSQTQYQWKCIKCGNIFKSRIYTTGLFCDIAKQLNDTCIPRCQNCYPFNSLVSNKEKQLFNFCKQYFPRAKQNYRKLINPLELDIIIPQRKLALEFNGIFWHSLSNNNIPFNYHLNKTQLCQARGYRLIHIWQDQWDSNKEQIKQRLREIFQNRENIDTNKLLDRCWYSVLQFQRYQLIQPKIIIKNNYKIINCGYLKVF